MLRSRWTRRIPKTVNRNRDGVPADRKSGGKEMRVTRSWNSPATSLLILERLFLTMLVATLLLVGFTGHAGVQVLDQDVAARIARLHLHGVSGEAAYVHSHTAPAPFVTPHCHAPVEPTPSQPSPDQVQAASTLAGATL